MIYSVYPDYDQYYLSFSSERLQKSWIRFTNSELAYATTTGDFAGIVKSAANRGDIIVFAPSIENVDLHEIKYFRFPNYVSDKFIINKIEDASLEDRKRLKCHLFIGDTQDKQEILKIIKDAIGWLNTLKNMDSPTIHRKNGSMEADALYINVYKHDIRHSKALHPANENFVCFVDCNGVQREHNKKLNNGLPKLHMDGGIHIVVQVAQVFKDGGPRFRLGQLIADVLKGNALGERASVNAAHTVRVDGLIRDGGLCRAGLAVTLVLAENGINFFFLGAGELFGLFGFAGYRFSGQWPLPPVPFGIAAQGRRKHCWSDRAFPWDE